MSHPDVLAGLVQGVVFILLLECVAALYDRWLHRR